MKKKITVKAGLADYEFFLFFFFSQVANLLPATFFWHLFYKRQVVKRYLSLKKSNATGDLNLWTVFLAIIEYLILYS